jgi:uncharacterized membrane protein YdfJ with MMPL/SSD domain
VFQTLGTVIYRWRLVVVAAGLCTMIVAALYGTSVYSHLDTGGFAGKDFESFQAQQKIGDHFGGVESLLVLFRSENGLKVSDPAFRAAVQKALEPVRSDSNVKSITDYYHTGSPTMVSKDGLSTFAVLDLKGTAQEAQSATKELRQKLTSPVLKIQTGGLPAINLDINTQVTKDLARAEAISFTLLAILLVLVFRGLVAASLPLLLGGFGVLGAFLVIRLLTNVTTISQYAINVIILLGLGLSIDYSLFMVSRFREELRRRSVPEALMATMKTAGRTVFFSALTVIMSLLGLLVFPINFLRSMGIGASAAVVVAMTGALTVLPALLGLLGNRVNWLSFGRTRSEYRALKEGQVTTDTHRTIWYRGAQWAMSRPVLTIGLVVVPLAFLGQFFLRATFSSADYRQLPSGAESRDVTEALRNNFPGASNDPIQIIVHFDKGTQNLQLLQLYEKQVEQMAGVSQVSGRTSGDYSLVNVSYNSTSDATLARDLVKEIRHQSHPQGWEVKVGGQTAALVDLLASLQQYTVLALGIVAAALVLLLFIMFRSVVVPFQALFVNVLSLSATFGALVWIFQEGHLQGLLGFTSVGSIDATQPVLIFGIAFGLSMDYSVFLLSRVKEQFDQEGDIRGSVAEGVQKTGPIITSAAILFIVVVAAFATSKIGIIKQVGVGLGLAVFLDAFLVRMLLVPAIMRRCSTLMRVWGAAS